ncbi:helix-turn-helix transcriptional regulator [Streptomyces sp. NBC_00690]|uniref:helix-turn-helix transcriptional regulator n=1 Tax=Streptomyces sp. NBC_00690 TaxID=2975808 RepID=UPI002E2D927C|nr:helix-turn-helix transcriptional regulator [Streptomyces sp. NBC_00690]
MPPVFAHGRLRLYLLKLLDESPRHGYEVIRLLEERFHGLYAPSAGTVYPRLAKLEAEGLVTHATEGGRKVYSLTEAGRAELAGRSGELADLELEIRESVSELAAEIRDDVRGAAGKLRSEVRAATSRARTSHTQEKEEWAKTTHEWQEQARRAREDAQRARRQAKEAHEKARDDVQRIAKQVQDQVQDHFARGDWPTGLREGLSELTSQLSGLARNAGMPSAPEDPPTPPPTPSPTPPPTPPAPPAPPAPPRPSSPDEEWLRDTPSTGDPARDLERLLDRFRDDIRDAAKDHGVTEPQLATARRHLSAAAAHIVAALIQKK